MDSIDMQIIELLKADSRMSVIEISKTVCLSRTSVKRRIDALIEDKTIEQFTIRVNPNKAENRIFFITKISNLKIPYEKMEAMLLSIPSIKEVFRVTGAENYVAIGQEKSMEELNSILEELIKYCNVETSLSLKQIFDRK